jgi:hypothetical protein
MTSMPQDFWLSKKSAFRRVELVVDYMPAASHQMEGPIQLCFVTPIRKGEPVLAKSAVLGSII